MPTLNFTLVGHDALSRIFDRVGDSAQRLHRRVHDATTNAGQSVNAFTRATTTRLSQMQRDTEAGEKALGELRKTAMLLGPAAIPAAASLVPIAAGALTVGAAVAAMGAAIVPQISALSDVAAAEQKYQKAVDKSGAASQEAVQAHEAVVTAVSKLPPETRKAAAAVSVLKDSYKKWSDSLAGDTMTPFVKGVAIANTLLPKTTGLVKAASTEADRFITIVGGEMASPGLDSLNSKFTSFAQKTLRGINDELVHLLRVSQGKQVGGPAREFMTWARAQGPTVASVLQSVAMAAVHLLQAGSDVGVGMLQLIDILAGIVSAVPPQAIATILQLAVALKVTKTAALGLAAGRTAVAAFASQLLVMQTAAAGAPTRLRGVAAAIGTMSRSAKVAMAGTGIGLLIIALTALSQRGKAAPPDVDRLTSSLKQLGDTGKVTGEAAKAFGTDLDGLYGKVRSLTDPGTADKIQQFLVSWTGMDSTPVQDAKDNLDAVDKSLASLVQSGQADLAAAALKRLTAEYGKGGRDTSKFTGALDNYKSALADAQFEQQLAAASMGVFGTQAQSVQAKLDAQKQSADGLRQSIQALNDVQRQGLGGMIGFEASIDAAAKAAKDNAGSLRMVNGELDVNSPKAQAAATALNDLAGKTEEAAAQARQSGSSWEKVNGIYSRGRDKLIDYAQQMGLSKTEAKQLADQILNIKDLKKVRVEMNDDDATRDLQAFNAAVKASPGSKSVTLNTLTKSGEQALEAFGFKVKRLKDGSVKITAKTGGALSGISNVGAAIAALHDKTVTVTSIHNVITKSTTYRSVHDIVKWRGGPAPGFAAGGMPGGLLSGPGTGTSDSIPMWWASTGEYIVNAKSTAKYLPIIEAINQGRLGMGRGMPGAGGAVAAGLASGMTGSTGTVHDAARTMAAAVTAGVKDELEIASPSKKAKALMADFGKGLIQGLTGSRDKIRATAKDLAKDIRTAFDGRKESSLVRMVDQQTRKLLDLAAKRDKLAARIAEAKQYAGATTATARSQAALSNLGMGEGEVTAGGIKAGLAQKLAQIKQFARYINTLAKRGLNKALLRQILDMGPVDGYAYASALVSADKATLSAISRTETAINKQTGVLGRKGADILYDSGKNAGRGFLAGLQEQQASIEKLMERIAKGMQKALRKALGIASPAKKVIPDGINFVKGLAVGVIEALPHLDNALGAVAGRMTGGLPAAGRPALAAAGGGTVINVQVDVHDAMDPVAVGREFQRVLLQFGRVQGATVSLKVG